MLTDVLTWVSNLTRGKPDYAAKIGFRVKGKDRKQREESVEDQLDDLQRRIDRLFVVSAVAAFEEAFLDEFDSAAGKGRSILQDRMQRETLAFRKHGARLVKNRGDTDGFKKIIEIMSGIGDVDRAGLDELRRYRNTIVHVDVEGEAATPLAVQDSIQLLDQALTALRET
ncbi:MAG TPA: hypothetical protein VND64_20050 [Pirellulales bacterium]|nr:hypothetical protein [Pirellulales bacterium]